MADFRTLLTVRYDFDEVSGNPQDSVGSKNATSIVGSGQVYNGDSITINGQAFVFPNQFDVNDDFTVYIHFRFNTVITVDSQFYNGTPNGFAPVMVWRSSDTARFHWNNDNGGAADVPAGRANTITEEIGMAASFRFSDKTVRLALLSTEGLSGSVETNDTDGTVPTNRSLLLGQSAADSSFYNMELFEMGAIAGTFTSIADLQDTLVTMLGVNSAPTGSINSIIQRT